MIISIYGDFIMKAPQTLFAQQFTQWQPPVRRSYSFELQRAAAVHVFRCCNYPGWIRHKVAHSDIYHFLFAIPKQTSEEDRKLSVDICRAWAQFAKTGHPGRFRSVEWTESRYESQDGGEHCRHMLLNIHPSMAYGSELKEICQFWEPRWPA